MALKPDDLPELPPLYLGPQIRARVHQNRDLFSLFVAAICVGLLAGAVAGSFRLCLNYGAQWRNWLINFLHSQGLYCSRYRLYARPVAGAYGGRGRRWTSHRF